MKNTLKENRDFRRLYYRGRSAVSDCLVVYALRNKMGPGRLGITTGTKLGHAVVRNRLRRVIREIYRQHAEEIRPDMDVVIVARARAVTATYQEMDRAFVHCAEKIGLIPRKKTRPES
ncbi:MAG: ribonuclease P protein component [Eubacteriales bacterium]|nr:ribonuclease P protein component [Eubacteriales bacterium]